MQNRPTSLHVHSHGTVSWQIELGAQLSPWLPPSQSHESPGSRVPLPPTIAAVCGNNVIEGGEVCPVRAHPICVQRCELGRVPEWTRRGRELLRGRDRRRRGRARRSGGGRRARTRRRRRRGRAAAEADVLRSELHLARLTRRADLHRAAERAVAPDTRTQRRRMRGRDRPGESHREQANASRPARGQCHGRVVLAGIGARQPECSRVPGGTSRDCARAARMTTPLWCLIGFVVWTLALLFAIAGRGSARCCAARRRPTSSHPGCRTGATPTGASTART